MIKWNRNVAIVGVGQTKAVARLPEQSQLQLVNEAVQAALDDAGLEPKDIEFNAIGDMELFQGDFQSDMWQVGGYYGYMKDGIRMTTGGTTGGMLVCTVQNYVASGMYDVAMAIGFQKHDEGNASTGLTSAEEPMWDTWCGAGVGGAFAQTWINKFGDRAENVAAKVRAMVSRNAALNLYAHLRNVVTEEEVNNSPYVAYPMRLLHLCPQSTAACAVIVACEKRAREITDKPVWIKDYVVSHTEESSPEMFQFRLGKITTMEDAARKLYERNHITDPINQIDLIEMYDPTAWFHMLQLKGFLQVTDEQMMEIIENGTTEMDGALPVNPSGGVMCTNPIGATPMIRIVEAALQIRGQAGARQVDKEINTALATSFGGILWTIVHLLSKDID